MMKLRHLRFAVLSLILFSSAQAIGQLDDINIIKKRIAVCASIKGNLERLECYDQLARELGLMPKTIVLPFQGTGSWLVTSRTNPVDDSTTVRLFLTAEEGKSNMTSEKVSLNIRCQSNKTELYINWHDYLGDETIYVLTRIGNAQASSRSWNISTDNTSTFYSGSAIQFIKSLLNADRLVAKLTPYNESPITAVFDIRGLSEAIKPLQQTCGWK